MLPGLFVANLVAGTCWVLFFLSLQVGLANIRGANYQGGLWSSEATGPGLMITGILNSKILAGLKVAEGFLPELMASAGPVEECFGFCCWGRGPGWTWLVGALSVIRPLASATQGCAVLLYKPAAEGECPFSVWRMKLAFGCLRACDVVIGAALL
ncbi:hypothetical protein Nepgr_003998 [Nepenthes gracilis]|uniref:Uncharacterized protein n=1 Tax=Nepenthes gracilis TaxID=150966 RepID=A0AAD3XEG7_NEPGR|nr:hypothetical protein Nepgr_003998 [Nepenthes gracilis]